MMLPVLIAEHHMDLGDQEVIASLAVLSKYTQQGKSTEMLDAHNSQVSMNVSIAKQKTIDYTFMTVWY